LIAEKVRIPKTKTKTPFRPRSAALEVVQKYEDDQVGGPDNTEVLIAWHQPLSSSSRWNWDAITILAEKARSLLKESKLATYNNSWLELPELMKQIAVSLKETKAIMAPSSTGPSMHVMLTQRRRARKTLVSNVVPHAFQATDFFLNTENSTSTPNGRRE
jgi:hypothetical protein